MGVNGRAALAVCLLLLLIISMWLNGTLENLWNPCLKRIYIQPEGGNFSDNVGGEEAVDDTHLSECPGQDFQASQLLLHLRAAPVVEDDVLIQPYLSSWDELIKFLNALGPMVGLISQEIEDKTGIIRKLAQQHGERWPDKCGEGDSCLESEPLVEWEEDMGGPPWNPGEDGRESGVLPKDSGSYRSVRSMIATELHSGLVNFQQQTASGCRTLLRLHRALLWLQLFLEKLGETPPPGAHARSPSDLCREAYRESLSRHHTWLVRRAAELAFIAMPERSYFFRLVCAQNQQQATLVLNRMGRAIKEVYTRTEAALAEHGMLDLP